MKSCNQSRTVKCVRAISMTLVSFALLGMMATSAHAAPKLSKLLDNNGFETLLGALNAAELTAVLDENTVTLFAPTDDVFAETADALGCLDAADLANKLLGLQVGDTNALVEVLSYHATLRKLRTDTRLLRAGEVQMVSGDSINTGVNQAGLYAKGIINSTPSTITTGPLRARRNSTVYAIDQILLPIDPTGICSAP